MAVRSLSEYESAPIRDVKVYYNVTALAGSDTSSIINLSNYADKTVHIYGTFDSGTLVVQGSNKPTESGSTMETLHKTDLSALSFTAAGIATILENPMWIRASVSGGGGSCAIVMSIVASTQRS